jgi:hypothetical protein
MTDLVFVATPAYGGLVHVDHVRALFDFASHGIPIRVGTIANESLITRARNALLAQFHADRSLTHLLFLDADTVLPPGGLAAMLAASVPVIGAAVALKGYDEAGNRVWNIGRCLGSAGALLKVEHVGTAALLLNRAACDALVEDAIADGRVYRRPPGRGELHAPLHYDVFRVGAHGGDYVSEDYWVCRRLRSLGFDILVDPAIITRHQGTIEV